MSKRKVAERPEIHGGTGNVYRDLGFPDAEEMLVKAQLVCKISETSRRQLCNAIKLTHGYRGLCTNVNRRCRNPLR